MMEKKQNKQTKTETEKNRKGKESVLRKETQTTSSKWKPR